MGEPPNDELDTVSVNRQIKDGVFRLLFDSQENAAELYYALTGIKCEPDDVQIITITTTVSGKLKNDLAFVVKGKALIVGEHMSSPYENMPVRLLMYTGLLYEKWIKLRDEEKFLYSSKLYKIPAPEFVVFYNGTATKPEKEILCLSSAFDDSKDNDIKFLELQVPVYNINKGMNEELFSKSAKLKQYSEFIAKLREYMKLYEDYARAVKETLKHCIANGILADFLREQGGNIVSILATEYDEEAAKRVYGEELVEEIVIKMLKRGTPIEIVAEDTGVDEITVKQLKLELAC